MLRNLLFVVIAQCLFHPSYGLHETPTQNYAEALHKSFLFYEAQKSGKLDNQRLAWRSDSCVDCYGPNGEDLTRGYYEAANTMKWGLPYAFMITQNAWNAIAFEEGMRKANEFQQAQDMVKWGTDYLVGAYSSHEYNDIYLSDEDFVNQFKFVGHMGNSDIDFEYFGPPEEFEEWAHRNRIPKNLQRPVYYVDKENPSSEICGESAAAMAAGAILLRDRFPDYADMLVDKAKSLLRFAIVRPGNYKDSDLLGFKQAFLWYPSSSYIDEISWGAVWIYRATGDSKYLDIAQEYYEKSPGNRGGWGYSWAEKGPGIHLLMMQVNGPTPAKYIQNARRYFDSWMPGDKQTVEHTPGGLGYIHHWGANRYAANTAMLCLVLRKYMRGGIVETDMEYEDKLLDYAAGQVNYLLGENPEGYSWMVGYGSYYPLRPYHKSSYNSILNYPLRECPCVTDGCDCYYEEDCACALDICKSSGYDWEPHRCECKTPSGRVCDSIRENEMDFTFGEKINQHILYGALVGSPVRDENWIATDTIVDNRNDYEYTEVTQDYNAGFTGALAGMAEYYYDYTVPYSDCGLDLGWEHPNAPPRPDWPENDCYHRCDCTPTAAPTKKPIEPTMKPTARPTKYCPDKTIENGWTSCEENPGCCANGLYCFRQNEYWAACFPTCEEYMQTGEDGKWEKWACERLDEEYTDEEGCKDGKKIVSGAVNCMDNPDCCAGGMQCFEKNRWWAACMETCEEYQQNDEGGYDQWSCKVLTKDVPTKPPVPSQTNSPVKSPACGDINSGAYNCMDQTDCCNNGKKCFEKNQWWAACLETCNPWMKADNGEYEEWSCSILTNEPESTPAPSSTCSDTIIEDASKNCKDHPDCCRTGNCYQKNKWWAACLPSCTEYMSFDNGNTWEYWECLMLEKEPSSPTPSPSDLPAYCPTQSFVQPVRDCSSDPDCCPAGTSCYRKTKGWAECLTQCKPGWVDVWNNTPWECLKLNRENNVCDQVHQTYSDDCSDSPNCCPAGTKCYRKSEWWASCRSSCTPGEIDESGYTEPWECAVIEGAGYSEKLSASKQAPWFGTVVDTIEKTSSPTDKDTPDVKSTSGSAMLSFSRIFMLFYVSMFMMM